MPVRPMLISNFRGQFSDGDDTHSPPNSFRELYNFRLNKNKEIEKIPGYQKFYSTAFDTELNHLVQLIRSNGVKNIFCFDDYNIYRINNDTGVYVADEFRTNYPNNQMAFFDLTANKFKRVRSVAYQDNIFCVDENCYPFFIYNMTDEASSSLNVWARILVDPANSDSIIKVVHIEEDETVYKTITIDAEYIDGFLEVRYNDGENIYITNNKYIFKFCYGNITFDIQLIAKVSDSDVIDWEFKETSFAVLYDGGGKEFKYDDFTEVDNNKFIYKFELDASDLELPSLQPSVYSYINRWRVARPHDYYTYDIFAGYVHGSNFSVSLNFNLRLYDVYGGIINKNINNTININDINFDFNSGVFLETNGFSNNFNFSDVSLTLISNWYDYNYIVLVKDNILYIGTRIHYNYTYARAYHFNSHFPGAIGNQYDVQNTINSTTQTKIDTIVNAYNINTLEGVSPDYTYDELITLCDDPENYDMCYDYVQSGNIALNITHANNIVAHCERNEWGQIGTVDQLTNGNSTSSQIQSINNKTYFENVFEWKNVSLDRMVFYPMIPDFSNAINYWAVSVLGVSGRPTVSSTGAGITGTYRFYTAYKTIYDGGTETYLSDPSEDIELFNEGVRVDWADLPSADAYPYTIQTLRIYAQNVNTGEVPFLIDEIDYASLPADGYKDYTALTEISSVLNRAHFIPKCINVCVHKERLLLTDGKVIYYSEQQQPTNLINILSFVVLKKNDNDRINSWLSVYDRLFCWKKRNIYAIVGDVADSQAILNISNELGCIAPDSVAPYKDSAVFLSQDGITILASPPISVSKGVINNFIFSFSETELWNAIGMFDTLNQEYRLYINEYCVVFNMNNDFYIEKKLEAPYEYTFASKVYFDTNEDNKRDEIILFGTTEKYLFRDKLGVSFDGRERWCGFKSKQYKLADFEEKSMPQLFKFNASLNSASVIYNEKGKELLRPGKNNFYMIRLDNFVDDTFQYYFFEKSYYNCKVMDMEFSYE